MTNERIREIVAIMVKEKDRSRFDYELSQAVHDLTHLAVENRKLKAERDMLEAGNEIIYAKLKEEEGNAIVGTWPVKVNTMWRGCRIVGADYLNGTITLSWKMPE